MLEKINTIAKKYDAENDDYDFFADVYFKNDIMKELKKIDNLTIDEFYNKIELIDEEKEECYTFYFEELESSIMAREEKEYYKSMMYEW